MSPIQQHIACTLFATPIGFCGLAFGPHGILGVQLPEAEEAQTFARLARRCRSGLSGGAAAVVAHLPPGQTSPTIQRVIADIRALLEGQPRMFDRVRLDMRRLPAFDRRVYELARTIAPGQTISYGELAVLCDAPRAAREVGQALSRNPFPIIVPCHRVLAANGRSGGFSARGGLRTKLRLLSLEGAACAQLQPPATAERPNLALPF